MVGTVNALLNRRCGHRRVMPVVATMDIKRALRNSADATPSKRPITWALPWTKGPSRRGRTALTSTLPAGRPKKFSTASSIYFSQEELFAGLLSSVEVKVIEIRVADDLPCRSSRFPHDQSEDPICPMRRLGSSPAPQLDRLLGPADGAQGQLDQHRPWSPSTAVSERARPAKGAAVPAQKRRGARVRARVQDRLASCPRSQSSSSRPRQQLGEGNLRAAGDLDLAGFALNEGNETALS